MIDNQSRQREDLLRKKLRLLEEKISLQENLPHLYGLPMYQWQDEFFTTRNKNAFLTAANQIGKSTIQIRKFIHWATAQELWSELWATPPRMFWYLYPSKQVTNQEIHTKWIPDYLPRGEFKKHPVYGWELKNDGVNVSHIIFNSGVRIYFKTYSQDVQKLQSGTAHMIGFDEELPEDIYGELNFRRQATDGYLSGVFTATLGQEFWRKVIEEKGDEEIFPDAFKRQVSLYDCRVYKDGRPSPWTEARIKAVIATCKNQAEIDRRVHGKFVRDTGRRFEFFSVDKHVRHGGEVPPEWILASGVDIGSGGEDNHPGAFILLAINPQFTRARVLGGWRGGKDERTTAGDIYEKYVAYRGTRKVTYQHYDYSGKDFGTIAQRVGDTFHPADKSRDIGEHILATLFQKGMLTIDEEALELKGLVEELLAYSGIGGASKKLDDYTDALRYAVSKLPWDFSSTQEFLPVFNIEKEKIETPEERSLRERRELILGARKNEIDTIEDELEYWNTFYDV